MDLFELNKQRQLEKSAPLADRLRPESLDDFVGQDHLVGEGKIIRRMIKADRIYSCIFYGPPGVGKTSLAEIISKTTHMDFRKISAVTSGISQLKNEIKIAQDNLKYENKKTILFIDEIHRFNKSQQDFLLPFVEDSTIILIGATTENPYFEVNRALISRMYVFEFKPLEDEDLNKLIDLALSRDKFLREKRVDLTEGGRKTLIAYSNGDCRALLNAIEIAVFSEEEDSNGIKIDSETIKNSMTQKIATYDRDGDSHYDIISAFIKSMRGSDVDSALYYLARMLEAGEDIKFIARRMMIFASEDIGNADPRALILATSCFDAISAVGMPEARIILSQTVIYLASSPKSNAAYLGISKALDFVKSHKDGQVPNKLRDTHYKDSDKIVKDKYLYPHDFGGYVDQTYLPDDYLGEVFYQSKDIGFEKNLSENLKIMKKGSKNED